jgi:hypothetical protein
MCTSLTSVSIPSNVTSIGDSAFFACQKIVNLTIPSSVTSVGKEAFYLWLSSQTINVPFASGARPTGWSSLWNYECNAKINYSG